jgi:hypothetical protein
MLFSETTGAEHMDFKKQINIWKIQEFLNVTAVINNINTVFELIYRTLKLNT